MEQLWILLAACVAPVNIVYTVLLAVTLIYWSLVILGALDIELFDFDLDFDADADLDLDVDAGLDADADIDVDAAGQPGFWHGVLTFFGFAQLPVMIILSVVFLLMWIFSIMATVIFNTDSILFGLVFFVPNLLVSLSLAKILTIPLRGLFKALEKNSESAPDDSVLGQRAVVSTSKVDDQFGQVTIETGGSPLVLNAVAPSGQTFWQDQEVVVVFYNKGKQVYEVQSLD